MVKEEIKKMVENSKKGLDKDHENMVQLIKDDLKSFKKKTLDRI